MLRPELTAIDIHFSHELASMRPDIFSRISRFNSLSGMLCEGFDELIYYLRSVCMSHLTFPKLYVSQIREYFENRIFEACILTP
jgi:hypothetical protein